MLILFSSFLVFMSRVRRRVGVGRLNLSALFAVDTDRHILRTCGYMPGN